MTILINLSTITKVVFFSFWFWQGFNKVHTNVLQGMLRYGKQLKKSWIWYIFLLVPLRNTTFLNPLFNEFLLWPIKIEWNPFCRWLEFQIGLDMLHCAILVKFSPSNFCLLYIFYLEILTVHWQIGSLDGLKINWIIISCAWSSSS